MIREDKGIPSRMTERIEIHLRYEGPDVDNGTMAVQDVIPALQGFSGAFAKVASSETQDVRHRITLSAIRQGSADIILEVFELLAENSDQIGVVGLAAKESGIARHTIRRIFDVVKIKLHVGGEPYTERISVTGDNNVVIINSDGNELVTPRLSYESHKKGDLDRDLERLTRPLEPGRIDSAEFQVQEDNKETISQIITAEDRPYFEVKDLTIATTEETELIATLNSLTKSTNSGYLHLSNGRRVFYSYIGEDAQKLYTIFGNYDGPVKIQCRAKLDDQLEVVSLEILDIERMQNDLFD